MNKIELIEKISNSVNVQQSEHKLFFEKLLRRVAEELNEQEFLSISGLGRFEIRKALNENENDLVAFITNDNEELLFSIPEEEEVSIAEPVDSYFSISIGKPIIPLKGSGENEFFIPQSGDEIKKIIELKLEKLIDESNKYKVEPEDTYDLDEIKFPFINWKRSSDINEEIDKIEQELDESLNTEIREEEKKSEEEYEQLVESKYIPEEEIENEDDKVEEMLINESETLKNEIVEPEVFEIDSPEEELEGTEIPEATDQQFSEDNLNENIKIKTYESVNKPEETKDEINLEIKKEVVPSLSSQKSEVEAETHAATNKSFLSEEDDETIHGTKKKSFFKYILAAVIVLAAAVVLYYFYFYKPANDIPVTIITATKKFNVVVERTYDIPVSYPYQAGMFGGVYEAIDKNLLKPANINVSDNKTGAAGVAEVRNTVPSTRIKGYIYQYSDGTFAVQVSSFKSRSVAISETQRYLDAGHTAFVEQTEMSGKPYYRVRVGGFNSLAEAEKFSQK